MLLWCKAAIHPDCSLRKIHNQVSALIEASRTQILILQILKTQSVKTALFSTMPRVRRTVLGRCDAKLGALMLSCNGVIADTECDGHRQALNLAMKEVNGPFLSQANPAADYCSCRVNTFQD